MSETGFVLWRLEKCRPWTQQRASRRSSGAECAFVASMKVTTVSVWGQTLTALAWEQQRQRQRQQRSIASASCSRCHLAKRSDGLFQKCPPVKINWQIVELSPPFVVCRWYWCWVAVLHPVCSITEAGRPGDASPLREGERERWREREEDGWWCRRCVCGGGKRAKEGDRERAQAWGDTSRCQTHRHTAATDSSLQPRLEAQLDTGNERAGDEEWSERAGRGEREREEGRDGGRWAKTNGHQRLPKSVQELQLEALSCVSLTSSPWDAQVFVQLLHGFQHNATVTLSTTPVSEVLLRNNQFYSFLSKSFFSLGDRCQCKRLRKKI